MRAQDLEKLAALGTMVPRLGDPTIGVVIGVGAAYFVTRKNPKWSTFWLTLLGAFVAQRLDSLISQRAALIAASSVQPPSPQGGQS